MKKSSFSKRRHQKVYSNVMNNDSDMNPRLKSEVDPPIKDDSINFATSLESYPTLVPNQFGSDEVDRPYDSGLSWRVPATLVLIWTIILILIVFLFIIKKTVFSKISLIPKTNILPTNQSRNSRNLETNAENEWMFASYNNDDYNEEIEVPLSTNISRD